MYGKPLDAYIETKNPSLYMLGKKNDNELKIGIWNLFDDKCSGIRVKINVPFGQVEFINCKGHVDGEAAVIDSVLYPYEFCALKVLP
jgi:hypothetical protein